MISVQTATCTDWKQLLRTGAMATGVLNAAAAKCASTTPWQPRLPWLQLSGTVKLIVTPLTVLWHTPINILVGCVRCVATDGLKHRIDESAKRGAVPTVLTRHAARRGLITQPLQTARTLEAKLFWQKGTMNAMHLGETFPKTLPSKVISRFSGSATAVQQGSSTAGLQFPTSELAATRQAARSVLGRLFANATLCRRCTLTLLQSGTTARIKISPMTTLPALRIWRGGVALSVSAGSRPFMHVQILCVISLLYQSVSSRG